VALDARLTGEVVHASAGKHGVVLDLGRTDGGEVVGEEHKLGLAGAKGLERGLVAEGVLARLHHQRELGVDVLGTGLLLQAREGGEGGLGERRLWNAASRLIRGSPPTKRIVCGPFCPHMPVLRPLAPTGPYAERGGGPHLGTLGHLDCLVA